MDQARSSAKHSGNRSRIDPWLVDKGFRDHPFARWDAEVDEHLENCYVDLGEFDLHQHLTEPCVFLAGPGCGKTAQRQMLAAQYRPHNPESKWLAVPYTFAGFEHVLRAVGYDLSLVHARHHVEAILCRGLTALHQEAERNLQIHQALGTPTLAAQWAAHVTRFAPHLLSVPSPGVVRTLDTLSSPELLSEFAGLVRAVGLDTCAILVDGVDEFMPTAGDAEMAVRFLAPLLGTLSLLGQPGLAFKFFLPQWMEPAMIELGWLREDRIRVFRRTWTRPHIEKMFRQRMRHLSSYRDLAQLCNGDLAPKIMVEIARLAGGSPRIALRLASALLRAHCHQDEPADLIALETWEEVKKAWATEHGGPTEVPFPVLRVDLSRHAVYLDDLEVTDNLANQQVLVLESLYRHSDQVCERGALIEEAWGGGTASEDMLTEAIKRLREEFKKHAPDIQYIWTIQGRGYCLYPEGMPRQK